MKKIIQLLLVMVLMLGGISESLVTVYSQDNDTNEAYKAYYKFLDNLIYGDDKDGGGIGVYSSKLSDPINENIKQEKGIIYAGLGDLDNDENKDLVCMYLNGDNYYNLEVYDFKKGKLNKVFSTRQPLNIGLQDSNSISTVHKGEKTYIGTYEYLKKDMGFDEVYKFYDFKGKSIDVENLEISCNLTLEQQKDVVDKKVDQSQFYTYKQTKNNSTKKLKKEKFEDILDSYQQGETFLMEHSSGTFYTQLDLNRNSEQINEFLVSLLIESMPRYSFEDVDDTISDSPKLKKFLTTSMKEEISKPQIKKAYEIEDGYYYLAINGKKSVQGKLETSPDVYFAVVKNTGSGDFKMLRLENKPFNNEDDIKSYISKLKDEGTSNEKTKNNIILKYKKVIIGVLALLILFILFFFIRKINNKNKK
ncbi:hypothetical protein CHF27_002070 [Romboutsia maritimum]|uniref:Uncharacterized protein n=1 Tax=Romboutsia maritimum TaxID=2020948 RepID=A0A371IX01_9FIRM|nr:hypothetical protein [Romboutsia maritimum]RDY25010.1 hypothetical protein CHF27_002070 [Romboutsia maritimum]